jgi:Bifunctional DNA primase/polymerase, N-terminal
MTGALDDALGYAARGWPVSPWGTSGDRKFPLTEHGHLDATVDPSVLERWWARWPGGIPAIATGEPSGVVALDVDIRPDGSGFDSLEDLGITSHPEGPTAHTPRGGCAVLFRWPGHFVKTIAGKLAPHLDIRGDHGSLILPPGPGRFWDPHLGPDTPLAPMPEWMVIVEHEPAAVPEIAPRQQRLSRYAEAALDGAVKAIVGAPNGQQRDTLNREIYSIAQLVAGGTMPAGLAIESLQWAARRIRTYDPRRPWRPAELDKMVRASFADGLAHPRQPTGLRT